MPAGGYVIRAAAPLDGNGDCGARVLLALYPVPQQLSQLAETVQRSYTQYANLVQLREPLKIDLRADPDLRRAAVAARGGVRRVLRRPAPGPAGAGPDRRHARGRQGRLRHQLPLPSRDELGFLVTSFNDMTKRLRHARARRRGAASRRWRRERARLRGDPGAPVDRRGVAGAGAHACAPPIRPPAPILGVRPGGRDRHGRFDESDQRRRAVRPVPGAQSSSASTPDSSTGASRSSCCPRPASAC